MALFPPQAPWPWQKLSQSVLTTIAWPGQQSGPGPARENVLRAGCRTRGCDSLMPPGCAGEGQLSTHPGKHLHGLCGTQVHCRGQLQITACGMPGTGGWLAGLMGGWWTDSSHRPCSMSALTRPHLGLCLWLWLGVALGLGQGQGKDVVGGTSWGCGTGQCPAPPQGRAQAPLEGSPPSTPDSPGVLS